MLPLVQIAVMKEIATLEFAVKCLALLDPVRKTKKAIRITRFGKSIAESIAEVLPPSPDPASDWMGAMNSRSEILGGYDSARERPTAPLLT
jgi:hypothetical protein